MLNTELEKVKEIFLSSDIDSEDYNDNLAKVNEWEASLRENEDFLNWQTSEVTKKIIQKAKEAYKDNSMSLIHDREMDEKKRLSVWAKQDAIVWLLSLVETDSKSLIDQIEKEIRTAIQAG